MKQVNRYLKVKWSHHQKGLPIVIYRELESSRFETRKVEEFRDAVFTYAHDGKSTGSTMLSEMPLPSFDEIARDPQFEPVEISKGEFERIWNLAITSKKQLKR